MSTIRLIQEPGAMEECARAISENSKISIDTEFLREKTYFPKLCLIQVHAGDSSYCVDALAIENLSGLEGVFSNVEYEKIVHSCRQDLEVLHGRMCHDMENMFDTQVAAAFTGHGDQVSYAAMVKHVCNVTLSKSHTRTDWSARPLSEEQLQYAVDDVRYLEDVAEFLREELVSAGRLQWHAEECERIAKEKAYLIDPAFAWRRLKGIEKLPVKAQLAAAELARWRERVAMKRNRPREWILPRKALIGLAVKGPQSQQDLKSVEGMTPGIIRKSGSKLLEIINNVDTKNDKTLLARKEEPLDRQQKDLVREMMKKMNKFAEESDISPSVISNRNDIELLVRGGRSIALLEGWRRELVGDELLEMAANERDV